MSATFEQWVDAVFNHPVGKPEWYWSENFDSLWQRLGTSEPLTVNFLRQLFEKSGELKKYSLPQVGQGIWFLVGESSPAKPAHTLLNPSVPLSDRVSCVRGITKFFRDYVAPSAPGAFDIEADPFHIACYMWWDIFPTWGGSQAGEPELHQACLNVMQEIVQLPCELCRLSALHGANHWRLNYENEVVSVIDAFLADTKDITPRIREYAFAAREGLCQ